MLERHHLSDRNAPSEWIKSLTCSKGGRHEMKASDRLHPAASSMDTGEESLLFSKSGFYMLIVVLGIMHHLEVI